MGPVDKKKNGQIFFDMAPACRNERVKHCAPVIASKLCRLYNECIKTSKFPDVLKCGKITPIHKKGARDDLKNY